MKPQLTTAHLFAGGWGDGRGYQQAGYQPLYAANHLQAAVDTARANCPAIWAQRCDINNLDMRKVPAADGLVGSPICTEVSPAAGTAMPHAQRELEDDAQPERPPEPDWNRTRMTAWDPIRYAEVHRPLFYAGENVPRFGQWELFDAWLRVWDALGYQPHVTLVNAAHIHGEDYVPVPQLRKRLVWVMVRRDARIHVDLRPRPRSMCPECGPVLGVPDKPNLRGPYRYVCPNQTCSHAKVTPTLTGIGTAIDGAVRGRPFSAGAEITGKPYVPATRRRVQIGLDRFDGDPFIITLRGNGTASPMSAPIGTITAQGGEHHYLVRPTAEGTADSCEYRALTVKEKARVQGFPDHHLFAGGDDDRKLQIGNAVPVNVARWQAERIAAGVAA